VKIKKVLLISIVVFILTNTTIINTISTRNKESTIVLVIGFGPFLSHPVNPSELIALELNGETICGAEIIGLAVQPNLSDFIESIEIVYHAIDDYKPDYVFSIGLRADAERIRLEKIGYNVKRENKGNSSFEKLIPKGRLFRISPLPTIRIVKELRKEKIPSQTSLFGGTSLCNGLLYSVLHYGDVHNLKIKSGFIHVPLHKSEEDPNGMELDVLVNATRIIIQVCVNYYSRDRLF
jgi:pyroglutamyl-peptidase